MSIRNTDWSRLQSGYKSRLCEEDLHLIELLKQGKSTPAIADILAKPRSTIWGRVLKLKARLAADQLP